MSIGEQIAAVAKTYIGFTEIPGNKGFTNKDFQSKMEAVGWQMTYAWCAFFCELVWKEAYGKAHPQYATIDKLFSPSALSTYYNFAGNKTFPVSKIPVKGAIMIFKHGINPAKWEGHCGVVIEVNADKTVFTVEGNTNDKGGREGYIVSQKTRLINKPVTPTGLNLIGFVHPI